MAVLCIGGRDQIIIELQNIFFAYDEIPVLCDVSLHARRGEAVALCGSNGAGKSTLLKIINGLIFPSAGNYKFEGHEVTRKLLADNRYAKYFHQRIGFVWQNPDVQLFCASVEEELAFGPQQMGLSANEVKQRVEDSLEFFGLTKLRHRAPYSLSGGEKKKTAVASVLTMNPTVWTLDEPLSSLDEKVKCRLTEFLLELKSAGKTIIFSSHDSNFIDRLADRKLELTDESD